MNTEEMKDGKRKAMLIPTLFFLTVSGFLFFMLKVIGYFQVLYCLNALSLYMAAVLFVIELFTLLQDKGFHPLPRKLIHKLKGLPKLKAPRVKQKKTRPTESVSKQDTWEASAEQAPLMEIMRENRDNAVEPEHAGERKKTVLIWGSYLFLQLFFAYLLLRALLPTAAADQGEMEYGFLHAVSLVVLAGGAMIVKKLLLLRDAERGGVTACGFCSVFGFLCVTAAVFIAAFVMFSIDYFTVLVWLCRGVAFYTGAMVLLGIPLGFVRKNKDKQFDYFIYVPFINAKNPGGDGVLDLLEKNTGLSFKSLWSIRYVLSLAPGLVLAMLGLMIIFTSVYKIEPHQQGAVYRLGVLTEASISQPGIHLKLPWPIDKLEVYDVKREQSLQIGYESEKSTDFLWTKAHEGGEYSLLLGNGNELVAVNIRVTYFISDLYHYLCNYKEPAKLMEAAAYEIMMKRTIHSNLDNVLSVNRSSLAEAIEEELKDFSQQSQLGMEIGNVIIQSIHPPVDIADAYQSVVGAGIQKESLITTAETRAYGIVADAQRESESAVISANIGQTERVAEAQYEREVFQAAYGAYRDNPQSFKLNKYLAVYEKVLEGNKVYIFTPKVEMDLSKYIIDQSPDSENAVEMTTIE